MVEVCGWPWLPAPLEQNQLIRGHSDHAILYLGVEHP
jgi:hypothetical protein